MDSDFSNLDTNYKICEENLISKKKSEMIPICKKYLRFLDNSEAWGDSNIEYDVSLLLNYWLYYKISAIHGFTNIDKIKIDYGALQGIWDHFNKNIIRKPYYYKFKPDTKIFDEEDWEKIKELYEYYVDYDTLLGTARGFSPKCEEYYGRIKKMISVYKFFEEKCLSNTYKCPNIFYKCKAKNIESSLEQLSCHDTMKDIIVTSSEEGSSYESPDRAERHLDHAGGPAAKSDIHLESGDSGIGTKVTNSVLGAAPVLLTATALYRYTHFGSWIRKLRGDRTNSMNAMDGFSPYAQEAGDMFSDDTANYISYQPI
ncbi:hypothetical protein PVMG_06160 [Plasmodium vivax Mauritania I]|uniref:Uncharacterized protein n=1 Tax=Plasmodium vivax Mauritania I TaxID=1035515 RepID=A0A0J9TIC9_PLAVI|nr:hypothetical protein PVMG_06160 [Plasmodium vivax Mauritania I]